MDGVARKFKELTAQNIDPIENSVTANRRERTWFPHTVLQEHARGAGKDSITTEVYQARRIQIGIGRRIRGGMVESISKIPDSIKRMVFFQKTATLMGISEEILLAESNKIHLTAQRQKQKEAERKPIPPPKGLAGELPDGMMSFSEEDEGFISEFVQTEEVIKPIRRSSSYQEQECVRLLISHGTKEVDPELAPNVTLMQYILEEMTGINFEDEMYQQMITLCRENFEKGLVLDMAFFIGHEDEAIRMEAINLVTEKYQLSENWAKMHQIFIPNETEKLADLAYTNILRLKKSHTEIRMKNIRKALTETQDEAQQNQLLTEFMQAKQIEKQIAALLGTVIGG